MEAYVKFYQNGNNFIFIPDLQVLNSQILCNFLMFQGQTRIHLPNRKSYFAKLKPVYFLGQRVEQHVGTQQKLRAKVESIKAQQTDALYNARNQKRIITQNIRAGEIDIKWLIYIHIYKRCSISISAKKSLTRELHGYWEGSMNSTEKICSNYINSFGIPWEWQQSKQYQKKYKCGNAGNLVILQ